MPDASLWLAAYDIAAPRRLRRIAACCEDYGRRLQQSVFLCECPAEQIQDLLQAVTDRMEPSVDHFVLLPLCARCQEQVLQYGREKALPGDRNTLIV